jgi:hypothetical protein
MASAQALASALAMSTASLYSARDKAGPPEAYDARLSADSLAIDRGLRHP